MKKSVTTLGNSVVIKTDAHSIQLPKNTIILTSEKDSKSVNVRLLASRKVIETIDCTDLGYNTADEAVKNLSNIIN